jgi:hypothetical protein
LFVDGTRTVPRGYFPYFSFISLWGAEVQVAVYAEVELEMEMAVVSEVVVPEEAAMGYPLPLRPGLEGPENPFSGAPRVLLENSYSS